ncbi:MAG TPA: Wzz/FepE/Etk N-terminal domain-containing protein [Dongiaceae bacterium]|nr:Wzz/FepE/Etk N-terminal domain-containing protein [Dongiaceae bacterium]
MLRNGEIDTREIKRILRRFWWVLPTTTFVAAAIALAATFVLPKKYTSSTMVLVEPPAVSKELIPMLATEDLYHRLASMKEQILSRSRLQPIIEKLNLYAEDRDKKHMEDLVDRLRQSIDVSLMEPMAGSMDRQPPGFRVSVTFKDPRIAQQICTDITSMFMEQNALSRTQQAVVTAEVLTQQVNDAKGKLDEQDAKLAQFKRQFLGSLPEEQQSNMSMLTGLYTQLEAANQQLSRSQQDKTFNETLLNQQEATSRAAQTGTQSQDSLDQQLSAEQSQLAELLAKYTPEHPDVIKLKAQIEDTKRRMAAGADPKPASGNPGVTRESPQVQQLRAKIKLDEISIADTTKHQAQVQDQIRMLQGRVQASPMVEQQIKELTRNYQTASDMYNDLLKKQQNSSFVRDMENKQQSETFRVLDPPSLPISPSFPKKIMFLGGGAGAGLALGLGILYLVALTDKTMYSERDVELCLKLPVLTMIPSQDMAMSGMVVHPKP